MKEALRHLGRHYHRNWIWFWLSICTAYLGVFLRGQREILKQAPPWLNINGLIDTSFIVILLFCVATAGILISLWNITLWNIKYIFVGALSAVWVYFLLAFIQIDFGLHQFSIGAGLTAFVIILIFHNAKAGG